MRFSQAAWAQTTLSLQIKMAAMKFAASQPEVQVT
jgi:hypothetical protein